MLKSHYNIDGGTIIFQSLKDESLFNRAVSRCGAILEPEAIIANVNHVGLYIGDNLVIEATSKHGVITQQLDNFLAAASNNIIATIKQHSLIESAILRAKSCLGLPYNHSFHPDGEGFYCSELITYAFKTKHNQDYFRHYPMNFIDCTTQQVLPYWIAYYQSLNQAIPNGLPGSHPQQLLRQTYLFEQIQFIK